MFINYFTSTLRNLLRNKVFSFINILGLAIGLACCAVIFLFIQDELKYDLFHEKSERIFRVVNKISTDDRVNQMAMIPPAFGPTMEEDFYEVENFVRFFDMRESMVNYEEETYHEKYFLLADTTVFDIFSFKFLAGDPNTALNDPSSLVISKSVADKFFKDKEALGKTLTIQGGLHLKITGVFQDLPSQSHFKVNLLGSIPLLQQFVEPGRMNSWSWQQFFTYVLLAPGTKSSQLEEKLPDFINTHASHDLSKLQMEYDVRLQKLTDVHLYSADLEYDNAQKGNIQYVYIFSIVAFLALIIACFNFMNLSTAQSAKRAKEVGLRKVIGAKRGQLIWQFLCESVFMVFIASIIALGMVILALPAVNSLLEKSLTAEEFFNFEFLAIAAAFLLLVGILAGIYPAFFLSGYLPVKVLKGDILAGGQGALNFRKILVISQFAISAILIIGTLTVSNQLRYIQNKNLGFEKEQLVILPILNSEQKNNLETFKNELLVNPAINSVSATYGIPGGLFPGDGIFLPGDERMYIISMFLVDNNYIPTLGMEMVAGRKFSENFISDPEHAFVINETAVKYLGFENPEDALGKELIWNKWNYNVGEDSIKTGQVIGVVKDFHFKSFHQKIEPLVMHIFPPAYSDIVVKVHPENLSASLAFLEKKWQEFDAKRPFEYKFVDEQFAQHYSSEQTIGKFFGIFTSLSIFIACLGLFGLATFTAQQRTKEIGVRKVLGASTGSIVTLLSQDFLKLVMISFIIAVPVASFAMHRWLQDFAYRINLSAEIFILSVVLIIFIALISLSFQVIKAALTNPVRSLRSE